MTETNSSESESENSRPVDDRAEKSKRLHALFRPMSNSADAVANLADYLDALAWYSVPEVEAGCESLRDTWTDAFRPPLPGHVRHAVHKFASKSRAEMREELERQRRNHAYENRMTPAKILAELARLAADPAAQIPNFTDEPNIPGFEARCRARYISGLKRILAGMEGREQQAIDRKRRDRGQGGLRKVGESMTEVA